MFFLYHRTTRPTGRAIAQALGMSAGVEPPLYSSRIDTLIRWGSRVDARAARIINKSNAIAAASDKLLSLRVLEEAGILVPRWSEDPTQLQGPILGRRTQHTRGTDIVLCLQRSDWEKNPRDYYTEYIPTVREFRIHVAFGEVIRVQGKYLDFPEQAKPWMRNYGTGYRYRTPRLNLKPDRTDTAVRAVTSLGLDFGAVDMLIGDDDAAYVLEVNTAPACSPMTAEAYVNAFSRELNLTPNLTALRQLATEEEVQ